MVGSLRWATARLPGFAAYIGERTQFFDDTLLAALEAGVRQVVIAGAGYDGRALRYRRPCVTYFEVDHPATQADKRDRLARVGADAAGLVFVPVDFRRAGSVADALATAGHNATAPTHFLCEGVTAYLAVRELSELFRLLAQRAAPGSTFAVDVVEPSTGQPLIRRVLLRLMRTGTAIMGERMVTLLTADNARDLLGFAGWPAVVMRRPPAGLYPVVFALAST